MLCDDLEEWDGGGVGGRLKRANERIPVTSYRVLQRLKDDYLGLESKRAAYLERKAPQAGIRSLAISFRFGIILNCSA